MPGSRRSLLATGRLRPRGCGHHGRQRRVRVHQPGVLCLNVALGGAEHLAGAEAIDADRHDHGPGMDLPVAAQTAVEVGGIEADAGGMGEAAQAPFGSGKCLPRRRRDCSFRVTQRQGTLHLRSSRDFARRSLGPHKYSYGML